MDAGPLIIAPKQHVAKLTELATLIRSVLRDSDRKPKYQGNPNPMAGHCYVASELAYHMLGGRAQGWVPQFVWHEGERHWYLGHPGAGIIFDLTVDQFETMPDREKARGIGFLTRGPCYRTLAVMGRMERGE